jgi:hypothetical protein
LGDNGPVGKCKNEEFIRGRETPSSFQRSELRERLFRLRRGLRKLQNLPVILSVSTPWQ